MYTYLSLRVKKIDFKKQYRFQHINYSNILLLSTHCGNKTGYLSEGIHTIHMISRQAQYNLCLRFLSLKPDETPHTFGCYMQENATLRN